MKPHITYWRGTWACASRPRSWGVGHTGYGYTPSEAYREWLIVNGYTEGKRA